MFKTEFVFAEDLKPGDSVWVKSHVLEIVTIEDDDAIFNLTTHDHSGHTLKLPWPKIAVIRKIVA